MNKNLSMIPWTMILKFYFSSLSELQLMSAWETTGFLRKVLILRISDIKREIIFKLLTFKYQFQAPSSYIQTLRVTSKCWTCLSTDVHSLDFLVLYWTSRSLGNFRSACSSAGHWGISVPGMSPGEHCFLWCYVLLLQKVGPCHCPWPQHAASSFCH